MYVESHNPQSFNFRIIEGENKDDDGPIPLKNKTTSTSLKPRSSIQMASTGPSQTIQVVYFKAPWQNLNR